MLVLGLIPEQKRPGPACSHNDGLRGTRALTGYQSLQGDHSCRACDGCTTEASARLDVSRAAGSGKTLIAYSAWIKPGNETHRHRVHNNGGGGRGTVVNSVDHKKPEIQCKIKRAVGARYSLQPIAAEAAGATIRAHARFPTAKGLPVKQRDKWRQCPRCCCARAEGVPQKRTQQGH